MQDIISEASEFIMDEVHVVCAADEVTVSIAYFQSARRITLTISQRDDASGQKAGYQLEVTESYLGYGSKFATIGSNMSEPEFLKDLSEFVMSPSEYSTSSSPREPLTSLRLGNFSHHNWDVSSSDGSVRSTANLHDSKHSSSKYPFPSTCYSNLVHTNQKAAAEVPEKDRATGAYLLKLLNNGDFDKGLVNEFKEMINMVRHVNCMLFKRDEAAAANITASTLRKVEALAIEVIDYFYKLENSLKHAVNEIDEVKRNLLSLGPEVKMTHLKAALKLWDERIMGTLACPKQCEKDLFDGFATFFDAQIYHAFLQLRRENSKHKICRFTEHFDKIETHVGHVCATYDAIIRETGKFKASMEAATKRLLSNLTVCNQNHKDERQLKHFKRELAEQMEEQAQIDRATTAIAELDLNHPSDSPAAGAAKVGAAYTMSQYLDRINARMALMDARSPRKIPSPMTKKHASKSEDNKGNPRSKGKGKGKGYDPRGVSAGERGLKSKLDELDLDGEDWAFPF